MVIIEKKSLIQKIITNMVYIHVIVDYLAKGMQMIYTLLCVLCFFFDNDRFDYEMVVLILLVIPLLITSNYSFSVIY